MSERCLKARSATIQLRKPDGRPRLARLAIPLTWSREQLLAYVRRVHDKETVELVAWGAGADQRGEPSCWIPNPSAYGLEPGPWGFPKVAGKCPACGSASLFLAVGGHVTCSVIGCPNPCEVADLLTAEQRNTSAQEKSP